MLGIQAQKTMLGTYLVKGKGKIVCACKDFTIDGKRLFDFCSIKNTILDSDSTAAERSFQRYWRQSKKQQFVSPVLLLEHFLNMFVVDALLGNFDRHNGNWGGCMTKVPEEQRLHLSSTVGAVFCHRQTRT